MKQLLQEISVINNVFDQYRKKTDEITLFIKVAENQKDFVTKVIVSEETRNYISSLKDLSNSVALYNAAIISIYGSYELFLDELLRAYFEYLKRNKDYDEIPHALNEKHFKKCIEYLSSSNRFPKNGLSEVKVISALESTCVKKISSEFLFDLVISHGGNLKTKQLHELLKEFGFDNPIVKLLNHDSFSKRIKSDGFEDIRNSTELYRLDKLVDERNKVGHGWIVDDRIAFASLRTDYLSFFVDLCKAVKDMIVSQIIQDSITKNELKRFDSILHVWKNGTVFGINSKSFRLKVGEYLFCTDCYNWNYMIKIINLQNDRKDRKEIRSTNKDISIEVDHVVRDHYTIWGVFR